MSLKDIEVKPDDIRGMRAALQKYSHGSWGTEQVTTIVPNLLNVAESAAYHLGLNGEDKYTLLAWHALLELERVNTLLFKQLSCALPSPIYICANCPNAKPKT